MLIHGVNYVRVKFHQIKFCFPKIFNVQIWFSYCFILCIPTWTPTPTHTKPLISIPLNAHKYNNT